MAIIVTRTIANGNPEAQQMLNLFYPVGSYYETSDTSFNPNTAWGGTWEEDTSGRVLVAQDTGTFTTVGDTGGEESHTLITSEMPSHNHTITRPQWFQVESVPFHDSRPGSIFGQTTTTTPSYDDDHSDTRSGILNAGGGGAHNNLQPYIVVKRWHRTA